MHAQPNKERSMAKNNSKSLYIVALLLFLSGVGYLLFSGFSQNSVYFLNVSEALASPQEKLTSIRLFGTVAAEGIHRFESEPGVSFIIEDSEKRQQTMSVVFKGAVPDTFKAGANVILEGGIPSGEDVFVARTLMTKCPSKYQKENR